MPSSDLNSTIPLQVHAHTQVWQSCPPCHHQHPLPQAPVTFFLRVSLSGRSGPMSPPAGILSDAPHTQHQDGRQLTNLPFSLRLVPRIRLPIPLGKSHEGLSCPLKLGLPKPLCLSSLPPGLPKCAKSVPQTEAPEGKTLHSLHLTGSLGDRTHFIFGRLSGPGTGLCPQRGPTTSGSRARFREEPSKAKLHIMGVVMGNF